MDTISRWWNIATYGLKITFFVYQKIERNLIIIKKKLSSKNCLDPNVLIFKLSALSIASQLVNITHVLT